MESRFLFYRLKLSRLLNIKKTGKIYASKEEFDKDVADPKTSTTKEDFRQDLQVTVASLTVFGKTK